MVNLIEIESRILAASVCEKGEMSYLMSIEFLLQDEKVLEIGGTTMHI